MEQKLTVLSKIVEWLNEEMCQEESTHYKQGVNDTLRNLKEEVERLLTQERKDMEEVYTMGVVEGLARARNSGSGRTPKLAAEHFDKDFKQSALTKQP